NELEATSLSPNPEEVNASHAVSSSTPKTVDINESGTSSSSPSSSSSSTQLGTTPTSAMTDTTSPATSSTEYIEPKVENSPPMIRTRLPKYAVTSGKSFVFTISDDTFYDSEDFTNLRLELTDKDGHELRPSSWLQFNAETRELYGLPLEDAVSKYQYRLSATDSGNESVTEMVEMSVQQHRGVRSVNHEINIALNINVENANSVDWKIKLIKSIATTLDDSSTNSIVVREIRQTPTDPHTATFVYFNETLPTNECPETEFNNLIKRLDATRLNDLVYPKLSVKSITGQLIGACEKQQISKNKPVTHITKNSPPMPRNQVDRVNATVGHLLVYKVPSDTFYDPNDNELTLTLRTKDNKELGARHWLQFDSKNQEFYGIPKSGDIGSEEYLLVAEDSGGLSATDALVVVVSHAIKKEFTVYFKAHLAIRHEQFNADLQRKFVERISQLFGDHTTQNIQIRSVTTQHVSDSTIVNFYNTSLYKSHNRCSEEDIEAARNVYLVQEHVVHNRVKKVFGPELNLTDMQVNNMVSCHHLEIPHREFIPTKTEEPSLKSSFADHYMYSVILPAVIIISMILIAALVALCLHRRRHKSGKMELGDEEERKSFKTRGIPVIFQDELDEKPEIGNKSPIILKDEKPPLLPPSYNTSNMNGDNDVDEYVPPPAVVVGGREARGKSPATPSYRKPPPYVSP
ncbi:dystroglycan-like, partial [Teleopsis dalmanni]